MLVEVRVLLPGPPREPSLAERLAAVVLFMFSWILIQGILFKAALLFPQHGAVQSLMIIVAGAIEVTLVIVTARALVRWTKRHFPEGHGGLMVYAPRPGLMLSAVLCVEAEAADAEALETATEVLAVQANE